MESKVIIPPTLPTYGHATVYVYPTVSPKVVVVPILTCIIGFPVLVLLIICALRYRARKARFTAKRTHMRRDQSVLELASGPSILASRCNNDKEPRASFKRKTIVRFKPMPEIDLDTVVEEKSEFDAEVTASDLLTTPEEFVIPEEDTPAASFRAYRYMGGVQGVAVTKSPIRSPHVNQPLVDVNEEMEISDDFVVDTEDDDDDEDDEDEDEEDDDEEEEEMDDDDGAANDHREVEGGHDHKPHGGTGDNDTTCFSLSPKQVTKSPTAVHLALKKLDGVMNRRHSSPVKVNYGNQRPQRSSGKVNYSYTSEEGTLTAEKQTSTKKKKKKEPIDYIDRELMPGFSSPSRSHSVRTPARKSQSFCSRRRGESFKHKKQSLARSISHKLSSSQENVKKPDLIEMGECSASNKKFLGKSLSVGPAFLTTTPRPLHNSMLQFHTQKLYETNENSSNGDAVASNNDGPTTPTAKPELRIELDPKAICGAISLTNGSSGTESSSMVTANHQEDAGSYPLTSPIHPRSWSCSVTVVSDRNDRNYSDSPSRKSVAGAGADEGGGGGGGGGGGEGSVGLRPVAGRKAWATENRLGGDVTCPPLPLKSPERLIGGSIGGGSGERGRNTNGEKHYTTHLMNDYSLKYRQEDSSKYKSHCQTCTITVDSDDERSTLV